MNSILIVEKEPQNIHDCYIINNDQCNGYEHDLLVADTPGKAIFLCMLWQPVEIIVNSASAAEMIHLQWMIDYNRRRRQSAIPFLAALLMDSCRDRQRTSHQRA